MAENYIDLNDGDIHLLRGWYGVLVGEGRDRYSDYDLAKKIFGGRACGCATRETLGKCHACDVVEEA